MRERLCRYVARPAVAEKRLTVNAQGKVVYLLKTPYRDGTTHVVLLRASCPPPLRGQPSAAQNRSRRFCRAARLHCKIGGVGAAPEGEPHAIPRCTRTEPPLACGGDAGRKGQGEECGCSATSGFASTIAVSFCTRLMMAAGVFAGASIPEICPYW